MTKLPTGTVTFLFTDIEGSTRLLQELGDRYHELLAEHHRVMREAFLKAGGAEIATEGDSFFVVFKGAPDAVAATVAMQTAFASHPDPEVAALRVRMGLHSGEGVLAGDNYGGIDVHRAARISSAGHGGQVVVSESTRSLVEHAMPDGVTLRDLGTHRLKDLARPEQLFQLVIPELRADFPELRTLDARPTNLRVPPTSFIGREPEIALVKELLASTHLLTLTGPGGTGKTRLSIQAASELLGDFSDGVFFVALAPVTDPARLPSAIANALDVAEEAQRDISETLMDYLTTKQMLLVLDNFEQIIDGAPFVGELLAAAPNIKALVSSREALRVTGEQELPVPPLGLPDVHHLPPLEALSQYESVALFIQRGQMVDPSFRVTEENAPAIAEICTRLDGLPLAIELAAARVKLLPPKEMLARLESRLDLLATKARDLPARQQTLRGAIAWSYDLLDPDEQALFRRLSVFIGGFTLDAAEQVCSSDKGAGVLDVLGSLQDKSLVRMEEGAGGDGRFRMLQTIRDFALEVLQASGDEQEMRRRHAEQFRALAKTAEPELTGTDYIRWLDRLGNEHDNLRAALKWAMEGGDLEVGLATAAALWRFWQLRGHLREGRVWLDDLVGAPGAEGSAARADAVDAAGSIAYWQNDYPAARSRYEQSLESYRALGHKDGVARATYNLAFIALVDALASGDPAQAAALFEEARSLYEEAGDRLGVANALWGAGFAKFSTRHGDGGRKEGEETLTIYREIGDRFGEGNAIFLIAAALAADGKPDEAQPHFQQLLSLAHGAQDPTATADSLLGIGWLEAIRGNAADAVRLEAAGRRLRDEVGGGSPESFWGFIKDHMEQAYASLDEDARERASAEGRAMSTDEAVAYALGER